MASSEYKIDDGEKIKIGGEARGIGIAFLIGDALPVNNLPAQIIVFYSVQIDTTGVCGN